MPAGREAKSRILGQQALVRGEAAECQMFMGMIQGELELTPAAAVTRLGGPGRQPEADLPEQLAPREAESVAAADPHEGFDRGALERRRGAADEIAHAFEWAILLALDDGGRGGFLTPMTNESQTDSYRPVPRGVAPGHATLDGFFHRAPDVAHVDIG